MKSAGRGFAAVASQALRYPARLAAGSRRSVGSSRWIAASDHNHSNEAPTATSAAVTAAGIDEPGKEVGGRSNILLQG